MSSSPAPSDRDECAAASSYDLARMQAEHDLTNLPLRKRLRVYLGGVSLCERWIEARVARLLAGELDRRTGRG